LVFAALHKHRPLCLPSVSSLFCFLYAYSVHTQRGVLKHSYICAVKLHVEVSLCASEKQCEQAMNGTRYCTCTMSCTCT
jgi:hypothetical protein